MERRVGVWAGVSFLLLVLGLGASLLVADATRANADPRAGIALQITVTPGMVVRGHVWRGHEGGPGLAGVAIYRRYASYPWEALIATTGPDGYYQSEFAYIPGDEMVRVRTEFDGFSFEPPYYYWRHYYGYRLYTLDFIATAPPYTCYLPLACQSVPGDHQVKEETNPPRR